jgi:hypothetical protein
MIVWIVYSDDNDGSPIEGVFDSEEKAIAFFECRDIPLPDGKTNSGFYYEKHTIK